LPAEKRVRRVSLLHEVAITRIAATDLQRRRPAETRHDLVQERCIAEQLERKLGPVDRQNVQADLPAVGIDPADVGKLYRPEAARGSVLPLIQRIASHAIPIRDLHAHAITEDPYLASDFPPLRLLQLQTGVAE